MLDNPFLYLRTSAGDVDLLLNPTGDDIATSKRATGRPKDLHALDEIERLRGHSRRSD